MTGKFCSQCGEKFHSAEERSVGHFFGEFVHLFTHADSKLLKSLKYLFTRPGFLTAEFLAGRRRVYMSPLSLFFIGNLIYFLFTPVDALNSRYTSQTQGQFYSSSIRPLVQQKMEKRKWTLAEMEKHYNAKAGTVSKLLLIVLVFLLSIPLSILFYNRKVYYFDHLVFATEFVSFIIYALLEALPMLLYGLVLLWEQATGKYPNVDVNSEGAIILLLAIIWLYVAAAAKRVYRQKWVYPRALLFAICTGFVVLLYRYLLFHATLWAL
jgi:hypothetical protein